MSAARGTDEAMPLAHGIASFLFLPYFVARIIGNFHLFPVINLRGWYRKLGDQNRAKTQAIKFHLAISRLRDFKLSKNIYREEQFYKVYKILKRKKIYVECRVRELT